MIYFFLAHNYKILIKKIYGDRLKRHKKRKWKLNRLNIDKDGASVATNEDKEYLDFLEDLEEDPKSRENINIYKGIFCLTIFETFLTIY